LSAGFDYADDGYREGLLDVFEGQGCGGVAGYYEEFGALFVEEFCAGDCVAGYGVVGLGTIGEAGGVAKIDVAGFGDEGQEGAEDGEAAEA
jgi:hypothetical protein